MTATMDVLREKLGELKDVGSATSLLHWDMETYMPPKAAGARGKQIATMSAISHRMFTSPEFGGMLRALRDGGGALSEDDRVLVSETLIDWERATKFPESYVKEFAEKQSAAFAAWQDARKKSDWSLFAPHMANMVDLAKRAAGMIGYKESPYDALLDDYERGMTAARLRPMFKLLAERQKHLVARIASSPNQPDLAWAKGDWPRAGQEKFGLRVIADMGFDMEAGRQDLAAHPFCTNFDIFDVRLTTRFHEDMLLSALFSTMHEAGHGLYEQGFKPSDARTTLASAPSLGMHESQSRMWENMIGRSRPFWDRYAPLLRECFPGRLDNVSAEQMWRAANEVTPSLIRVEADEVTYNLHVIIRFEVEVDLIEGRIGVNDVPRVWNAKYKDYLGVDVPNDAKGCLQDVHWSHGSFGYFPTYTLGNLYAGQLFEKILKDMPGLWELVGKGELKPLREWLRRNIHEVGRRKTAPEIVKAVTGRDPDPEPYLKYLESKYAAVYGL